MSRVTFHTRCGEQVELLGVERHYAGNLVNDLAFTVLFGSSNHAAERRRAQLTPLLEPECFLRQLPFKSDAAWVEGFRIWWATASLEGAHLLVDGVKVGCWDLALNTAIVLGSDAVELLARLHAVCEIHGYVLGQDREWLAEIIEQGREDNVLRPGVGWSLVAELLRKEDDGPVVMSYSVTDGFPNTDLCSWFAGSSEDDDPDAWNAREQEWMALDHPAQWDLSWEALMEWERKHGNVRLDPDTWGIQGFGNGWSMFDLLRRIESLPWEQKEGSS